MATYTFLNDYPSNHGSNWTERLQGVTHDSEHWFFAQEEKLWKSHTRRDLSADPITVDEHADMPDELKDLGCNHFGDPDHFVFNGQGYLFVPVEGDEDCGKTPIVAVFRNEQDLPYVGFQPLENATIDKGRIGWCAINPTNRLLHTSYNEINDEWPIFRYQVDWDALENNDEVIITPESNMTLWETPARQNHVHIPKYIQGGTFSDGGKLYIAGGKAIKPHIWPYIPTFLIPLIIDLFEDEGGIFVFDLFDDAGEAFGSLDVKSSLTDTPFLYEYHPGHWKSEEPEGLTYWDIDGLDFQVPGIEGQLHAILLDNNYIWPFNNDEIYFKHYRIA